MTTLFAWLTRGIGKWISGAVIAALSAVGIWAKATASGGMTAAQLINTGLIAIGLRGRLNEAGAYLQLAFRSGEWYGPHRRRQEFGPQAAFFSYPLRRGGQDDWASTRPSHVVMHHLPPRALPRRCWVASGPMARLAKDIAIGLSPSWPPFKWSAPRWGAAGLGRMIDQGAAK